jgi:hypothetical protein
MKSCCYLSFLFVPFLAASAVTEKWEATLTSPTAPSFAAPRPLRAKYDFSWSGITGASADIRVTKTADNGLQLEGSVHTTGLVRPLWKFDGTHVFVSDAKTLRPRSAQQIENFRRKKVVTNLVFDPNGVTSREIETPGPDGRSEESKVRRFDFANVFDLYSAFLFLRGQPLKNNAVERIVVYPATSAYLATVTVVGREKITGPTGTHDAIKLDLQLSKIDKKRELQPHKKFRRATIWLSDDTDRLLLKIQAQIFVGTVLAELQSIS